MSALITLSLLGLFFSTQNSFLGNIFGISAAFFMLTVGSIFLIPLDILGVDCWNGSTSMLCKGTGIMTVCVSILLIYFLVFFALEGSAKARRLKNNPIRP